jgi:hypothetical protein
VPFLEDEMRALDMYRKNNLPSVYLSLRNGMDPREWKEEKETPIPQKSGH